MVQRVLEGPREELPSQVYGQELGIRVDILITRHAGLEGERSTAQIRGTALRIPRARIRRGDDLFLQPRWMRVLRPVRSGISKRSYRHISQEVCPWNRKFSEPATSGSFASRPQFTESSPLDWMTMSVEAWREFSAGSPIKRTKRRGFLRNVAVALATAGPWTPRRPSPPLWATRSHWCARMRPGRSAGWAAPCRPPR